MFTNSELKMPVLILKDQNTNFNLYIFNVSQIQLTKFKYQNMKYKILIFFSVLCNISHTCPLIGLPFFKLLWVLHECKVHGVFISYVFKVCPNLLLLPHAFLACQGAYLTFLTYNRCGADSGSIAVLDPIHQTENHLSVQPWLECLCEKKKKVCLLSSIFYHAC